MMYFLDFDRTVFDTDAFIAYVREQKGELADVSLSDMGELLNQRALRGELPFSEGELTRFIYEDAGRFLRDKENGVMLITFGHPTLQKLKIENALHGIPRISTIYTNLVRKGEYLAPHIGMYGQSPVFVDDSLEELENFSAKCPGAQVFEMRRDGGAGDGRWPVIHTLNELP